MKASAFQHDFPSLADYLGSPPSVSRFQTVIPALSNDPFPDLEPDVEEADIPIEARTHPNPLHLFNQEHHTNLKVVDHTPEGPVVRLIPDHQDPGGDDINPTLPASLIRKVEREIREQAYDSKIVFQACRGLLRGSREFDEAYTNARIKAYMNQPRRPIVAEINPMPALQWNYHNTAAAPTLVNHPLAVFHLGHLMRHFGLWVIVLLAAQLWTSWKVGNFADQFLVGGSNFYFSVCLAFMLLIDAYVWFSRRGGLYNRFIVPGVFLFILAVAPGFALQIGNIIQSI